MHKKLNWQGSAPLLQKAGKKQLHGIESIALLSGTVVAVWCVLLKHFSLSQAVCTVHSGLKPPMTVLRSKIDVKPLRSGVPYVVIKTASGNFLDGAFGL